MKKILYMASLLALAFTSCDPMEDTYDELDGLREPYTQTVEVVFGDSEYATLSGIAVDVAKNDAEKKDAESIGKYKSFSKYVPAADYIPMFLASEYATLDEGSVANVTYDYYHSSSYDRTDDPDAHEMSSADYDLLGDASGEPGKYGSFDSKMPLDKYLPIFLEKRFLIAEVGDSKLLKYKFYGSGDKYVEYEFDGAVWTNTSKDIGYTSAYELTTEDYDAMGEEYGDPGKYDNFSSKIKPDDYLPDFLLTQYPDAEVGDKEEIKYVYYGLHSDNYIGYILEEDGWRNNVSVSFDWETGEYVLKTLSQTLKQSGQYMLTKDGWVFDPTVIFTMVSEDYQMIVDYSVSMHGKTSDYDDSEYYYGASAKYSNFDLRLKNRNTDDYKMPAFVGLSTEDAVALTMERMKEGVAALLTVKYPNAVTQVSGIDVFYLVSVKAYKEDLTDGYYTLKFQCTKAGPSPEFTYVEGLE